MRARTVERSFFGAAIAAVLIALSTLVLAVALPQAPATFNNVWGFAPEGRAYTAIPLHALAAVDRGAFIPVVQVCLGTAWVAWLALLILLGHAGRTEQRIVMAVGTATLGLAVLCFPAVLSRDVLGYVAYGRVAGLYGLNPYTHGRDALTAVGDPTGGFLVWDTPLPYGPLWVVAASALSIIGERLGGVWAEVLLHKALAAVALVMGASAAARLAGRRLTSWVPIVILNPLLLIEGPGTGHNDIVMTAMIVEAARLVAGHRLVRGALVLGCGIAIKPVALAALPLLAWNLWRSGERRATVTGITALGVVPTVALSMMFGGPRVLVSTVLERAGSGLPQSLAALTIGLTALSVAVAILLNHGNELWRWLAAWVALALGIALTVMPIGFPWYVTWSLLPALALTRPASLIAVSITAIVGLQLTWRYALAM
jgi:alpha-1,6-mannosyltransferase